MTTFSTPLNGNRLDLSADQPVNVASPQDQVSPAEPVQTSEGMTDDQFLKSMMPEWNHRQCAFPIYVVHMLPEDVPEVPTGCPKRAHQTYRSAAAHEMALAHNRSAILTSQGGTPANWAIVIKRKSKRSSILIITPKKGWMPEDEFSLVPPDHIFKGTRQAARRYVELLNGFYTESKSKWAVLASPVQLAQYDTENMEATEEQERPEPRFNVETYNGAMLQVNLTE
ncbi:MAG: hypothetical protein KDA65_18520, partial [Planctomycetaceae bacterium]|nr:hypothetical protein [Planctomycetaceae bacterium]